MKEESFRRIGIDAVLSYCTRKKENRRQVVIFYSQFTQKDLSPPKEMRECTRMCIVLV